MRDNTEYLRSMLYQWRELIESLELFLQKLYECQNNTHEVRNDYIQNILSEINLSIENIRELEPQLHELCRCLQERISACEQLSESVCSPFMGAEASKVSTGDTLSPIDSEEQRILQRRRALAEALRQGTPVMINSSLEHTLSSAVLHENTVAIQVPDGKLAGGGVLCRFCGNPLDSSALYCSQCGLKVDKEKTPVEIEKVYFSALAPQKLLKGEYSMIDVLMYEQGYREVVDEIIATAEEKLKETRSGLLNVGNNAGIRIVLTSPDITIEDNEESAIWCGEYLHFSFAVLLPDSYAKRQVLFKATVYINDVIATKLKFIVNCKSLREQKIEILREDVLSAFVSYASQDRARVAMLIQGMKKARPDMDIFFDVESLRSGEDWACALTTEIERRDILFLCWSHSASQSKWVDTEWRYALAHKGIDSIEPIPIDPPGICPPPEELKQKHFNDKLLYIINSP